MAEVADVDGTAGSARRRIQWADGQMPVLAAVRERFTRERPFAGLAVAACLQVTAETGCLVRTLLAGGASVALAASNPLTTQADVAAALAEDGTAVFASSGADQDGYYRDIAAVLDTSPDLLFDEGGDLVNSAHQLHPELVRHLRGGCEATTSGVLRLRQMVREGALRLPMVAVDDTPTKRMVDNRYGTGQSTWDGILRATNTLLAGKVVVVVGFGYGGTGLAERARGMGARVVVVEVDPVRALEATLQGHQVLPMAAAAAVGDVFVTATGNREVVRPEHFQVMKDGALLANAGHFDVEIDVPGLAALAVERRVGVRPHADEYLLADGRRLVLLAAGRLVNLAAGEGHPPEVMDVAFAEQALAAEWLVTQRPAPAPGVYPVPAELDVQVARLRLAALGIELDVLRPDQEEYLRSWRLGTR